MTDSEQDLFYLMEAASEQQHTIEAALALLQKQQTGMTAATAQLQDAVSRLIPAAQTAAREGAAHAVQAALAHAAETAGAAVADACRPLLAGMAGIESQALEAETRLKGAVAWFGWRWAALAGAAVGGALLALLLALWSALWWQRAQLADARTEQEKIAADIAAAENTLAELEKRTGGVRYAQAKDGRFILVPKGFDKMTCNGGVPCIRLK